MSTNPVPLYANERLKVAEIEKARKLHVPSYGLTVQPQSPTAVISLQQGQGSNATSSYSFKPEKRVFSIMSWNIQDYKGSKIESNPICNWFVKYLTNLLKVDLLVILETCDDLTDVIASVEQESLTLPDPSKGPTPVNYPPEPTSMVQDDQYFDAVKKRSEAMAVDLPEYVPVGSGLAHRFVELPASFPGTAFQKGMLNSKGDLREEFRDLLMGIYQAYDVFVKKKPVTYQEWAQYVSSTKTVPDGTEFKLRTTCRDCSGTKVAAQPQACSICQGRGEIYSCEVCQGSGLDPFACDACQGSGLYQYLGNSVPCPKCGGIGYQPGTRTSNFCRVCHKDFEPNTPCPACNGAKVTNRCPTCHGLGTLNPDVRAAVLGDLTRILGRETLPGIDVETYTLLWRRGENSIMPSQFSAGFVAGVEDKAVRLMTTAVSLQSKNKLGQELGYQSLSEKFNSRMPVVIPLQMYIDCRPLSVPLVAFHTVWESGSAAMDKVRIESLRKVPELAMPTWDGSGLTEVGQTEACIIVGDMNLDCSKKAAVKKEYAALAQKGYHSKVPGVKTVFTLTHTLVKRFAQKKLVYETTSYDQFLVKGDVLNNNIIACGVVDIVDVLETAIKSDSNLKTFVDDDIKKADSSVMKNVTDEWRAIYLYRKFVSDHLPILMDLKIDALNDYQRQQLELQQAEAKRQLAAFSAPEPVVTTYTGQFTALSPCPLAYAVDASGKGATVIGKITVISQTGLRVEVVNATSTVPNAPMQIFNFEGPVATGATAQNVTLKLGDFVKGSIVW